MAEETASAQQASAQFEDDSLLYNIAENTGFKPEEEGFDTAVSGISELVKILVQSNRTEERVHGALIDKLVAEVDKKISLQMDEILHQEQFQKMESAWRGLKYVVDNTDFRENIKIDLLNLSKDDLENDFEEAAEIPTSGLYKLVHSEYGTFGGQPYGTIVGNYDFSPSMSDINLMRDISAVSAMSHAPFIAAASPQFFDKTFDDFTKLPNLKDLDAVFEGPLYTSWRGFRDSEDSRYFGLTLPRFMLRTPYDPENNKVRSFIYEENATDHNDFLWGNSAFAFATRLTESFANYRWCTNIIGPEGGGEVENLPIHHYESMGQTQTKIPTEILVTERRELELSENGFIPLTYRKGSDNAVFFSANTTQKPKYFGEGEQDKIDETNYKLGTQLPYLMITNRLSHYIKVLQREKIGSTMERPDLQRYLNDWIRNYVSDSDNPPASVRAKRPLRKAEVKVEDIAGEPGWYKVSLHVSPHLKYMGAYFDLSLVGKFDNTGDE